MVDQFFSSDWHLFHENIWKLFKIRCPKCRGTGTDLEIDGPCLDECVDGKVPARPFSSTKEMNEFIIERHNEVVQPKDHYTSLGDVTLLRGNKVQQQIMQREVSKFNGHGRLILGNHDHLPIKAYAEVFEKVRAFHKIDNLLFSHIPLHPSSIQRGCVNVHGHIHTMDSPPGPYINISVEAINYVPVSLDWLKTKARQILEELKDRGENVEP